MRHLLWLLPVLALAACGKGELPKQVKVGKAYNAAGVTYIPEYAPDYDETGLASWYGPGFHGNNTAWGEEYDQDDLTAAHKTLPLPSMVRVTNLENGKSAVVRVNDRGPFVDGRIIDLSKASADRLGVTGAGTAKVRVQYLREETENYWAKMNLKVPATIPAAQRARASTASSGNVAYPAGSTSTSLDFTAPPGYGSTRPVVLIGEAEASEYNEFKPAAGEIESRDLEGTIAPKEEPDPQVQIRQMPSGIIESSTPEAATGAAIDTRSEAAPFEGEPTTREEAVEDLRESYKHAPAATVPKAKITDSSPARGGFSVQAGSFSTKANAQKQAAMFAGIGKAQVQSIDVGGKTWWRVRVGPFKDRAAADRALSKVKAKGVGDARVVRD